MEKLVIESDTVPRSKSYLKAPFEGRRTLLAKRSIGAVLDRMSASTRNRLRRQSAMSSLRRQGCDFAEGGPLTTRRVRGGQWDWGAGLVPLGRITGVATFRYSLLLGLFFACRPRPIGMRPNPRPDRSPAALAFFIAQQSSPFLSWSARAALT